MSSDVNNLSNQTTEQPGNEPPAYSNPTSEVSEWSVTTVRPGDQTWDDSPPAYESLPDIPIWNVPVSHLTASSNDQPWNFPLPLPEYSAPPTNPYQNSTDSLTTSDSLFITKFLQGKPLAVGVFVILCAFAQITVGTILAFNDKRRYSETLAYGIPYWTSVCYITTGCLLIASKAKPTRCRVKTSLVFDILSMCLSTMGLIFNARDIRLLCKMDSCYTKMKPHVMDNYFFPQLVEPEFLQTITQLPPPPYTAEGTYKEDEEDETPD
ncbi:uncharacterized protein [Pyxicephalus adspersus]|uniref:uncharacterized protein isoform X2 n=1 Tax=Pyxicephalus adspersus TaxID=30357 RepID=UPI003B596CBC